MKKGKRYNFRCDDCKELFTVTELAYKRYCNKGNIYCPYCDSLNTYNSGD